MTPNRDHDEQVCDLFHRFCDQEPGSWDEPIRAMGLDPETESVIFELLRIQSRPCPFLDAPPLDSFPRLAAIEPRMVDGYEIIRQIGAGGMGIVYLAEDVNLKRPVALKMLSGMLTTSAAALHRFEHEAQSAASLVHPNIVRVLRYGRWEDAGYIASEYIDGGTLAGAIEHAKADGPDRRWLSTATEHVRSIASALGYAHQQGVIHRDVKPSNILIGSDGVAKLADFGVAKTSGSIELTRTRETPGTLAYMSPEQAKLIEAPVGPGSDVFSLGVVLYECITLEKLYPGDSSLDVLRRMDDHAQAPLRFRGKPIPADLKLVCQKALEWEPARRYATAGEFAEDLDRVIRGELILAKGRPARRRLAAIVRRRSTQLIIAGALALGALGIIVPMLLPDPPPTGRLIVRSSAPGSRVSYRLYDNEIQDFTGEVELGRGSVSRRLAPGRYRITVRAPGALAEFTRDLYQDQTNEIDAHPKPTSLATRDMILIPSVPALLGMTTSPSSFVVGRMVELRPYWIDRCEVTNAQYRAFVLETGVDPPPLWEEPYDPAIDPLPVTAVTLIEAHRYAEWIGKRLPTAWEWERAARGVDGRHYPWGNDFHAIENPGNVGTPGSQGWSKDFTSPEIRHAVMSNLLPAAIPYGADIAPDGGLHFFGNAAEMTDSPNVLFDLPGAPFAPQQNMVKGKHWNGEGDGSFTFGSYFPIEPNRAAAGTGFRCARSAD